MKCPDCNGKVWYIADVMQCVSCGYNQPIQSEDSVRLDWVLPIITGVDDKNADYRTRCIARILLRDGNADGRSLLDQAMKLESEEDDLYEQLQKDK